jgi:hypothetical protein
MPPGRGPRLPPKNRIVQLVGERWHCQTQWMRNSESPEERRIAVCFGSFFEKRLSEWDKDQVWFSDLQPGDAFPLVNRVLRYEGELANKKLGFRDVTDSIPKELVPLRSEICVISQHHRRHPKFDYPHRYMQAEFERNGDGEQVPYACWFKSPTIDSAVKFGKPVIIGDEIKIDDVSGLRVTRLVPPQEIEGVGRLLGWICFEDIEPPSQPPRNDMPK